MSYRLKLGLGGTYEVIYRGLGGTFKEHTRILVQGSMSGNIIRVIWGDTRILDPGSCHDLIEA